MNSAKQSAFLQEYAYFLSLKRERLDIGQKTTQANAFEKDARQSKVSLFNIPL